MATRNEGITEKLESSIFGAVQLTIRVVNTFVFAIIRPNRLIAAVHREFEDRIYLPPHLFLLICATAIGLFATFMSSDIDLFSAEAIEQFQSLSLSAYILYSIMLFAIASFASLLTRLVLKGYEVEHVQYCQALNFYVIGLFGIGAIFVLLFLSLVFASLDVFYGPYKLYFIWGASAILLGYASWTLFLLHSFTTRSIRLSTGEPMSLSTRFKVLFANLLVLILCVVNFLYPVSESSSIKSPLKGWVLELVLLDENRIQIFYQLKNMGDTEVLFSKLDRVGIYVQYRDAVGLPLTGKYCASGGGSIEDSGFVSVAAGKSHVFAVCINTNLLVDFFRASNYQQTQLDAGGIVFRPTESRADITLKPKVYLGSYSDRAIIPLK